MISSQNYCHSHIATGEIDLKKTIQGAMATAAGVGQIDAGAAVTGLSFGAAAPIGVGLIVSGAMTAGLGIGQTAVGVSERGMEKNIPSGAGELVGGAAAKATGDARLTSIGKVSDSITGLVSAISGAGAAAGAGKAGELLSKGAGAIVKGISDIFSKGLKVGATSTMEAAARGSITGEQVVETTKKAASVVANTAKIVNATEQGMKEKNE